jgi:hypothetical protein
VGKLDYFLGGNVDSLVPQAHRANLRDPRCSVFRNSGTLLGCGAGRESSSDRQGRQHQDGAYRAIAQHMYLEFQEGDIAAAAQLARSLERVWDKVEDYGADMALKKTHPDLFEQIVNALDEFITPLMEYKSKAPEPVRVKAAFGTYMEKLKLAD